MSNSYLLDTDGTWEHTALIRNNEQVDVSRFFVAVRTERSLFTDKMSHRSVDAVITSLAWRGDQPAYGDLQESMLPGRVELSFPRGTIVLTGEGHPVDPMQVRIEFDGLDVTESVNAISVDVDSPRDSVTAFLTLFRGHRIPIFGTDHVDEIDLLK